MRRLLGLAGILIGGFAGMIATSVVVGAFTARVLGQGDNFSTMEPLAQGIVLAALVLPPLIVVRVLSARDWSVEAGLFVMGWGCFWPLALGYLAWLDVTATAEGTAGPSLSFAGDPGSVFVYLFFGVLPLAGLWLIATGLRRGRPRVLVAQV